MEIKKTDEDSMERRLDFTMPFVSQIMDAHIEQGFDQALAVDTLMRATLVVAINGSKYDMKEITRSFAMYMIAKANELLAAIE